MATHVVIGHTPNGSLLSPAKSPHNRSSRLSKSGGGIDCSGLALNDRPKRSSGVGVPALVVGGAWAAGIELEDFTALSGRAAGR
jgi:hypothetical protein